MTPGMNALEKARRKHGKSCAELGAELGVSGMTIFRYESGQRMPCKTSMRKIYEWSGGVVDANSFYGLSK